MAEVKVQKASELAPKRTRLILKGKDGKRGVPDGSGLEGKGPTGRRKGKGAGKLNTKAVLRAVMDAAKDIHGKVNEATVKSIAAKACKKGKDTEDAIQIAVNMLRSGS